MDNPFFYLDKLLLQLQSIPEVPLLSLRSDIETMTEYTPSIRGSRGSTLQPTEQELLRFAVDPSFSCDAIPRLQDRFHPRPRRKAMTEGVLNNCLRVEPNGSERGTKAVAHGRFDEVLYLCDDILSEHDVRIKQLEDLISKIHGILDTSRFKTPLHVNHLVEIKEKQTPQVMIDLTQAKRSKKTANFTNYPFFHGHSEPKQPFQSFSQKLGQSNLSAIYWILHGIALLISDVELVSFKINRFSTFIKFFAHTKPPMELMKEYLDTSSPHVHATLLKLLKLVLTSYVAQKKVSVDQEQPYIRELYDKLTRGEDELAKDNDNTKSYIQPHKWNVETWLNTINEWPYPLPIGVKIAPGIDETTEVETSSEANLKPEHRSVQDLFHPLFPVGNLSRIDLLVLIPSFIVPPLMIHQNPSQSHLHLFHTNTSLSLFPPLHLQRLFIRSLPNSTLSKKQPKKNTPPLTHSVQSEPGPLQHHTYPVSLTTLPLHGYAAHLVLRRMNFQIGSQNTNVSPDTEFISSLLDTICRTFFSDISYRQSISEDPPSIFSSQTGFPSSVSRSQPISISHLLADQVLFQVVFLLHSIASQLDSLLLKITDYRYAGHTTLQAQQSIESRYRHSQLSNTRETNILFSDQQKAHEWNSSSVTSNSVSTLLSLEPPSAYSLLAAVHTYHDHLNKSPLITKYVWHPKRGHDPPHRQLEPITTRFSHPFTSLQIFSPDLIQQRIDIIFQNLIDAVQVGHVTPANRAILSQNFGETLIDFEKAVDMTVELDKILEMVARTTDESSDMIQLLSLYQWAHQLNPPLVYPNICYPFSPYEHTVAGRMLGKKLFRLTYNSERHILTTTPLDSQYILWQQLPQSSYLHEYLHSARRLLTNSVIQPRPPISTVPSSYTIHLSRRPRTIHEVRTSSGVLRHISPLKLISQIQSNHSPSTLPSTILFNPIHSSLLFAPKVETTSHQLLSPKGRAKSSLPKELLRLGLEDRKAESDIIEVISKEDFEKTLRKPEPQAPRNVMSHTISFDRIRLNGLHKIGQCLCPFKHTDEELGETIRVSLYSKDPQIHHGQHVSSFHIVETNHVLVMDTEQKLSSTFRQRTIRWKLNSSDYFYILNTSPP
ncbi:hypothetical protein BLNAU_12244 [Blattamonas nauphoetae]|uniref:Uncharacterized protein n=1 Tax=Blattamonas nauphoetae TaxID=2049346 RepID=A0ABQ9XK21_9EUKA|nr:hypothetical protein BLNAU_12244 [Blattamonas nauphoetae]